VGVNISDKSDVEWATGFCRSDYFHHRFQHLGKLEAGNILHEKLEISTLGGLRVLHSSQPVEGLASRKAHALLVYLAVTGEPQPRDVLADLLWQDRSQDRAMANLRVVLSSLREKLGPYLQIDRELIQVAGNANLWVDVREFQSQVSSSKLHEAVELYNGDFLEGFHIRGAREFEHWAIVQREQLRESVVTALQDLVNLYLAHAQYLEGLPFARRLLELNPLMESAHRNLMRMLALSGQRDLAIAQYEIFRDTLAEELGVEPSVETETLQGQILAGNFTLGFPDVDFKYGLPERLTPFDGRGEELDELGSCLDDPSCRLLTIVGPGGAGKSRVAIELAKSKFGNFPDGVFYISLAGLDSVESIVPTLAEAMQLKIGESADPKFWIKTYLRQKKALLLVDNFEHLLDGTDIVVEILGAAPAVKLLATSRVGLNVQGETLYRLSGMKLPPENATSDFLNFSSVELFVNSAMRASPNLQLAEGDLKVIGQICTLVDGLPLGIELSAAWVSMLTPVDIVREVGRGIDLFDSDMSTLPERQRSFRAVFDHSWKLLTIREKEILGGLSIFRGGFDRDGAKFVVGASLRDLMGLMNKSLVHAEEMGRYGLHELLRQSATEKIHTRSIDIDRIQDLHCDFFIGFLREQEAELKGDRQQAAIERIKTDYPNVQAAWDRAVDGMYLEHLSNGLDGLCLFYKWRRRNKEGEIVCRRAVEKLSSVFSEDASETGDRDAGRTLAQALTWQSAFVEQEGAELLQKKAFEIIHLIEELGVEPKVEKAFLFQQMGDRMIDFNRQEAQQLYEQSLELYDALGDRWGEANVHTALGWVATHLGQFDKADSLGKKSLKYHRSVGDLRGMADALWLLGTRAILQMEIREAENLITESMVLREQIGDRLTDVPSGPVDFGMTLTWIGKFEEARIVREEALAIYKDKGMTENIPIAHIRLAYANIHAGDIHEAERNAKIGLELGQQIGDQRAIGLGHFIIGGIEIERENYQETHMIGREAIPIIREIEGADELGWILSMLALAEYRLGEHTKAREHLIEGLKTGTGLLAIVTAWIALSVMCVFLIGDEEYLKAIETFAFVSQYPLIAKSHAIYLGMGRYVKEIEATLAPEAVAAAKAMGRARKFDDVISETLAYLENSIEN
jgi:predicted ATPase/DNA-binding SARP family transcriptional activator